MSGTELRAFARPGWRVGVDAHELLELRDGWSAAATAPGVIAAPSGLAGLDWMAAEVPGTAAGAMLAAGRWQPGQASDLDAQDWWFRSELQAAPAQPGEELVLALDGIATLAQVWLGDRLIATGTSMWEPLAVDVTALIAGDEQLTICCRALGPELDRRRAPRARWRTKLAPGGLRFWRTMLLGRVPGIAADPAAVGPWRPVRLERRRLLAAEAVALRPRLDGADGVLDVSLALRALAGAPPASAARLRLSGASGEHRVELELAHDGDALVAAGSLRVPGVARWWPHTHGEPALHDVRVEVDGPDGPITLALGPVGFRTLAAGLEPAHEVEVDGLDLHLNGVRIFARGAVWVSPDPVGLAPSREQLREQLLRMRDGGMNIVRVVGTAAYEEPAFHDLCDELGLLVWQDLMFANLDYPVADAQFAATVRREVAGVLEALAGRPSFVVLCASSEIEQQVAMLGLDPALGRGPFFGEEVPALLARSGADAIFVPSAPCGGHLPFQPDRGVANWFGVGGYGRPLSEARRAGVRFASECLAFANVPDEAVVQEAGWRAGVPRDAGASWDFADVRDGYVREHFGVDPQELRCSDLGRYLELSRAVTGELMAAVMGEWRRAASPCGGAIVLWLRDLVPGSGWGVLDSRGVPKAAYHHLRRALAPVAVWLTDEGLGGIAVHVANDRPAALEATLRLSLYRDFEQRVDEVAVALTLAPGETIERPAQELLGRFVDISWAYRFGPPAAHLVVASLEREHAGCTQLLSQAMAFPAGRPRRPQSAAALGLRATVTTAPDGTPAVALHTRRLADGVRLHLREHEPQDDALSVEPGATRTVRLRGGADGVAAEGFVTALNLRGRVALLAEDGDG